MVLDDKTMKAVDISYNKDMETVAFVFDQIIPKGSLIVLNIAFEGIHNDKMAGFYRSEYADIMGAKKFMVVTQFEATDCRRCFPSWDEVQRSNIAKYESYF